MIGEMKNIDTDKSEAGLEFRSRVKTALFFGFSGVGLMLYMALAGIEDIYFSMIPGMAFGVMIGSIGAAVNRYKKMKDTKNED